MQKRKHLREFLYINLMLVYANAESFFFTQRRTVISFFPSLFSFPPFFSEGGRKWVHYFWRYHSESVQSSLPHPRGTSCLGNIDQSFVGCISNHLCTSQGRWVSIILQISTKWNEVSAKRKRKTHKGGWGRFNNMQVICGGIKLCL